MACVFAFTALRRAMVTARMASTGRRRLVFGIALASPARLPHSVSASVGIALSCLRSLRRGRDPGRLIFEHLYAALLACAEPAPRRRCRLPRQRRARLSRPQRVRPFDQLFISTGGRWKRMCRDDATDYVDHDRHMHVEMRINTENDSRALPWGGSCSSLECVAKRCQPPIAGTGTLTMPRTKLLSGHRADGRLAMPRKVFRTPS